MAGKKILMLVGEFSEEYEIFVFEQAMHAVGHTVHVVCPDKKAGENIKTSLHDFEGDQTYTEKPGHLYTLNKTFAEVDPAEYDAVYCAGGRGPGIHPDRPARAADRPALPRGRQADLHHLPRRADPDRGRRRGEGQAGRGAALLRAGGAAGRRHLCRRRADRRLRRRQAGLGQGLAGPGRVHARVPEGAGDRDQATEGHLTGLRLRPEPLAWRGLV